MTHLRQAAERQPDHNVGKARECVPAIKQVWIASVTPWKINPIPMAATKKSTMRAWSGTGRRA